MKSVSISPGLVLENRDVLNARGAVAAVEYTLDVRLRDKLVVFDLDLTGSTNIALESGGGLKKRTAVQPLSRAVVGVARVLDDARSWGLETRYSWREENPGALQPGASKTEKLSEGVVLITTRERGPPDGFAFEVHCTRNATITLSMDTSRCANLALDSGLKSLSVVVPPFERVRVGALRVVDPAKGYSMLTRWSWTDGIASNTFVKDASPIGTRSPAQQLPAAPALKQPKREDISPGVVLITETTETRPTEIIYVLQVEKATEVLFECDFAGSVNLELVGAGGDALKQSTRVPPFGKRQVARLRARDPELSWKLVCRYVWEEEDVGVSGATSSAGAADVLISPAKPRTHSSLAQLLASIGMGEYAAAFEREELSLDLLRVMARNETEFRRSLQELGISKMGHREKILLAVKAS
jgi:hypothetical protein